MAAGANPVRHNHNGIAILDPTPAEKRELMLAQRDKERPGKELGALLRLREVTHNGPEIARLLEMHASLALSAKNDERIRDVVIFFDMPGTSGMFRLRDIAEAVLRHDLDRARWPYPLTYSTEMFLAMQRIFPQGQLYIHDDEGMPIVGMNLARIRRYRTLDELGTWDDIARDIDAYKKSYDQRGGALVPFRISVAEGHEGERLPQRVFGMLAQLNLELGTEVIGDFRPSGYAKYRWDKVQDFIEMHKKVPRLEQIKTIADFGKYVRRTVAEGELELPVDKWLRNLAMNSRGGSGLHILKVDREATVVQLDAGQFEAIRTGNDEFLRVGPDEWINRTLPGVFRSTRYSERRVWATLDLPEPRTA